MLLNTRFLNASFVKHIFTFSNKDTPRICCCCTAEQYGEDRAVNGRIVGGDQPVGGTIVLCWVAQCLYAPLHWWHNAMPIEVAYMPPCPPYMPASPTIQIMPIYTSPPSQILARGPNFSFKYNEIQIQVLIMGMWNRELITSDNCKCRVFLDVLLLELWCI